MESNVTLVESLVRFVITMVLAILAVYTNMFTLMVLGMLVMVTALAQWCPINTFLGRNKHMEH